MADSDLKINVTSTADTSGITDTADELKNLQAVANRTGETLAQVQARFAEGPKFVQAITQEATKTAAAFTVTRTEAAALANELVRGNLNARSLGTVLQGLGNPVALLSLGVFAVVEKLASGLAEINADQEKWYAGVVRTREEMDKLGQSIIAAGDAMRESALIKGLPLEAGLRLAQQEVIRLKTEQSLANLATEDGQKEYAKYQTQIQSAQGVVDNLTKAQQRQTDTVKATTDQIALNRAQGNEELTIQLRVQQVYDQKLKSLQDAKVPEALAKDLASETAESERQKLEAIRGQAPAQRDYNAALKDAQETLQVIRLQQTLTQGASFMGVDQKDAALLSQYKTELQQVAQQITAIQAQKSGGALDPATLARDNQEMIKLLGTAGQLEQKILAAQKPLQVELQNWANSFGSTMTQVGHTIEQTVGVALQGLNQWIVTGKFNLQSMMQQIEMLGLQLVEQLIIQRVVAMINARLAETQAVASSKIIAAAWASAATAVTIATEGSAAYNAPGAVAIALGGVQAALGIGGFAHGGVIPGTGTGDTVPAMLTPGEFVVNRQSAQAIGYGNLEEMNMYAAGGRVTPGRRFYGDWFWYTNPQGEMVPVQSDPGAGSPILTSDYPFSWDGGGVPSGGSPHSGGSSPPSSGTLPPVPSGSVDLPRYTRPPVGPQFPTLGIAGPAASGGPGIWGGMANLALHSMVMQHWAHRQGYRSAGDWLRKSGFTLPARGGGQGPGGAGRGMTRNFASGGTVTGGGASHVHVYPVMDRKAIMKDMASREGAKVIFDVVKGRRIDLGI